MKKSHKTIEWHIFTDGKDEYVSTIKEAKTIWNEWKKDGYTNIRLYKLVNCGSEFDPPDEIPHSGIGIFPQ